MNNSCTPCLLAIAAVLAGCSASDIGRDGSANYDRNDNGAAVATWAMMAAANGNTEHCWVPNDETAGIVIGFDTIIEPEEGDPDITVTVDGVELDYATEVETAGRFLSVLLDSLEDVEPGYHVIDVSGDVSVQLEVLRPQAGDTNCDAAFNSSDLVAILAAGDYDNPEAAGQGRWSTGDFDGSGTVDSSDLVAALSAGNYETGSPYAIATLTDGWVLAPDTLGAMMPEQPAAELLSLEDHLKDYEPFVATVTEDDYDGGEDIYTVTFPVEESTSLELSVELSAAEEAQLVDGGEVVVEIFPEDALFKTHNRFDIPAEVVCDDIQATDFRPACGDVWFRGDDGNRNFKVRGYDSPVYLAKRDAKKKRKKDKKGGKKGKKGKKGKSVIGLLIFLAGELPKDTCGFQIALGKCDAVTCFWGAGWSDRTVFNMNAGTCDAGPYGVIDGAINNCSCQSAEDD
ncbi:MAG: hypothetical protein K0V04_08905 [Deltaproteobacteria bacterium]|nr:hypothetical protein [Deltaproteobacteria bacterium]